MADVSERFSDTQDKPEASDIQVITHNNNNKKVCQQFDKHQKTKKKKHGSNKQKRENLKNSSTLMQLSLLV